MVDNIKSIDAPLVLPPNPQINVRSAEVSSLSQTEDETFNPSVGLSCSDPMAELVNGKCACLEYTQDVGQGCRYKQPNAFITMYAFMLHNASHVEDEEGEHHFININKHGSDERRDRVLGMVDQMQRVIPKLLRFVTSTIITPYIFTYFSV